MSYCRICDYCGAHLDPGERCDCGEGGLPWADERPQEEKPELDDMDQNDGGGGCDECATDG